MNAMGGTFEYNKLERRLMDLNRLIYYIENKKYKEIDDSYIYEIKKVVEESDDRLRKLVGVMQKTEIDFE